MKTKLASLADKMTDSASLYAVVFLAGMSFIGLLAFVALAFITVLLRGI